MRLKLKVTILSLTLFTFSLFLTSCVEEPEMEKTYRLSSVIRFVNVSNNINNLKVTIDGQEIGALNSLAIGTSSEYFDYPAGKKVVRILDEAQQVIYTREISIISLELMTFVIAGHYDQNPEVSTFGIFDMSEGETYVSHAPQQGRSAIYFVHGSAPVDTFNSKKYDVAANFTPDGATTPTDTTFTSVPLEYAQSIGSEILPGSYTFRLEPETGTGTNVVFNPLQIEAGFRYYMFVYGNPNNVQLYVDKVVPPAIRPRD